MTIIDIFIFEIFQNVILQIGEYLKVLLFVIENLEYLFLVSDSESVSAFPPTVRVRHEFKSHLVAHGLKILVHFFIAIQFWIKSKAVFEHCQHHSCKTSNCLCWCLGEEVSSTLLEFHLVVWDKSLVCRRDIDDVLERAGLFLNTDKNGRNLLRKVILYELIDNTHSWVLKFKVFDTKIIIIVDAINKRNFEIVVVLFPI